MDALSDRINLSLSRARVDRMELERHGCGHLWNGGLALDLPRSEYRGGQGEVGALSLFSAMTGSLNFLADPVRWARVFAFVPGTALPLSPVLPILSPPLLARP